MPRKFDSIILPHPFLLPTIEGQPSVAVSQIIAVNDNQVGSALRHFILLFFKRKASWISAHRNPIRSPHYIKKALYYQELLEKGYFEFHTALAKQVGISRTKTRLILQLLKLDEKIKDFILKIDEMTDTDQMTDTDPGLSFLTVYRLQPLLQLKSKERKRRKFWQIIQEQYPRLDS